MMLIPFYHLKSSGLWHLDVSNDNKADFEAIKKKSATDANIRKLVNFAYLDETLFDYLKNQNTAPILRNALTANLDTLEDQYGRWAKSIGKSDKTIKNYVGALKNSIPNWLNDAGVTKQSLLSVGSFVEYENIVSKTYELLKRINVAMTCIAQPLKAIETFYQTSHKQKYNMILMKSS